MRISEAFTKSPSLMRIDSTFPARLDLIKCSIFMLSNTIKLCPSFTVSPTLTSSLVTFPGSGE